ncbi:MAG: tryptophan--tRNA ligase [Patescibacteria group bacterium]|nr:tryptophan--tRNA ligase [Patescibacteria group bacterium]
MKRLITGFKPTGDIHLGNYLSVMKFLPDYETEYELFIFIPDFHALTTMKDKKELSCQTMKIAKALLSLGFDNKKTIIFKQSDVPEVCELTWIFNCILPMPVLERAHAFKDAKTKNQSINVGVFDYPVLMAADILMYNINVVPVGKDQKQHVEIARMIAQKFNHQYGKVFIEPKEIVRSEVETIIGIDGRKMSKSYNNVIGLFDDDETTTKKVMSIVTDSLRPEDKKNPENCNIFSLHKHFSKKDLENIAEKYRVGKISYKESKEILAKNINKELREIRARKKELDKNEKYVKEILNLGAEKAKKIAKQKMEEVRKKVGLVI